MPLALGLDYLLTHAAAGLGLPRVDEDQLDRLFGVPSLTLASSVAIAVAAGVGEELAVRGVLQPRLGLVFANLFFAAGHALQYSIDGVLSVFLLGLVFGALRAAFLAAHEGLPMGQQHLMRAIQLEYREMGKLSTTSRLE